MLVKDLMSSPVVCCTPWDTARSAARLMKAHEIGAVVVVGDISDPLLEGIVTDRDLCCGVIASGKSLDTVQIADLMTPVPVTCLAEDSMNDCIDLMQAGQFRRIPVVNDRGRCIGIVALADIALHAPTAKIAETVKAISQPAILDEPIHIEKEYFYCGQTHELDEILLLNRRRELAKRFEVVK